MTAQLKCAEPGCGKLESWPNHDEKNWAGDDPVEGAHPFVEPEPDEKPRAPWGAGRSAPTVRRMTPAEKASDPGPIGGGRSKDCWCTRKLGHTGRHKMKGNEARAPKDALKDPKLFPTRQNKQRAAALPPEEKKRRKTKKRLQAKRENGQTRTDKQLSRVIELAQRKQELESELIDVITELKGCLA